MKLYQIDQKLEELIENGFNIECVDPDTGEIDESKADALLDRIIAEREDALEAYGCIVKDITAEISAIRNEEIILSARRKHKEKRLESFKNAIIRSLDKMGDAKFESPRVSYSFRSSRAVEVTDSFTTYAQESGRIDLLCYHAPTPDKAAIKRAIEAGEEIPGAQIVSRRNLQIQ